MTKVATIPARVVSVAAAKRGEEDVVLLVVQAKDEDTQPRVLSLDLDNARKLYVRLGRILQGLKREES